MGLDLVPSCWTVQFCRALAAVACLWHFFLDMTSPLFVMWFGLNLWQVQASLARLGFRLRISATMHLSPVISHLSLVSVVSTWTCWMLALVGLSWLCLKNGWNMFGCSVESLNVHHAVCVCALANIIQWHPPLGCHGGFIAGDWFFCLLSQPFCWKCNFHWEPSSSLKAEFLRLT